MDIKKNFEQAVKEGYTTWLESCVWLYGLGLDSLGKAVELGKQNCQKLKDNLNKSKPEK